MSTNVFVGFDPYVAWLSVRSEQRPLDPYQLLNLESCEQNPTRINAAIIRQRQSLESFRAGAKAAAWEAIRDELEAAVRMLSHSDSKEILDASIQRKSALRNKKSNGVRASAGPTIVCRHCSKQNTSERKFCGGCGSSLWDVCGGCEAEVPVDERFCGICGSNLQAAVASELKQALATLESAKQLRQLLRFDEALYALRKLAKSPDPRLDAAIEDALTLIRDIERELADRRALAADALERAQMLLSGHAYEGAFSELDDVPEQFRTPEILAVRAEAHAKRQEITTLSAEIRDDLDNKRVNELLPKLERLLTLKPNHTQAMKLAGEMRDRLQLAGKKRLGEHRYGEALELLRSIPSFVRTPEIDKFTDHAEELYWLQSDLRLAPLANTTLLEIAERLLKVAPGNQEAARQKDQLQQRLQQPSTNARQRVPSWAAVPKRTHVGWPIDWLNGAQSISTPDKAHADALHAQPGQFFVALGLALHGLGKGVVDIDLMPEEKTNVFTQFKSMLKKKSAKAAWGIDFNTYGLRAVKLTADGKDGAPQVAAIVGYKHRKVLSQPDAELERGVLATETLRSFLDQHSLSDARVVVNMPGQKLIGRFFDMPPVELKKVHDTAQFEARHQIPMALESLSWDYDLITASGNHAETAEARRTVIVAGRDFHIQERLALLKEVAITPDVLQSDCVALHNFLIHEFFGPREQLATVASHDAVVAIDVGAECTNLVISSPSVFWFRTFNIAGDNFTEPLVRNFKLTYTQAELLKREPHRARKLSQLYAIFDPLLDNLASEINKSLDAFLKLYPDQTLSRIYGVGGGFQLHGLLRRLRSGK